MDYCTVLSSDSASKSFITRCDLSRSEEHAESLHKQDSHTLTLGVVLMLLNMGAAIGDRLLNRHLLAVKPVDLSKSAMVFLSNLACAILISLLMSSR